MIPYSDRMPCFNITQDLNITQNTPIQSPAAGQQSPFCESQVDPQNTPAHDLWTRQAFDEAALRQYSEANLENALGQSLHYNPERTKTEFYLQKAFIRKNKDFNSLLGTLYISDVNRVFPDSALCVANRCLNNGFAAATLLRKAEITATRRQR